VVGGDEAGALGNGDKCAEVVEEIHEEENEDDLEEAFTDGAADVELKGGRCQGMNAVTCGGPMNQTHHPCDSSSCENADEN
jgi:hypothetical protein